MNNRDHVIFLEDIEPIDKLEVEEVVLIDHNELDKRLNEQFGKKVTRIVDHHVDKELYKDTLKEK